MQTAFFDGNMNLHFDMPNKIAQKTSIEMWKIVAE